MNQKTLFAILIGLGVLVIILVIGSDIFLRRFGNPEKETLKPETNATPNPNQILDTIPSHNQAIIFDEKSFSPHTLTVNISSGIGCLITVTNRTEKPIRVGVSPHSDSGDPGANYGEIAPNEEAVLDVRYPGLDRVSLHNHASPEQSFTIVYGEGCR